MNSTQLLTICVALLFNHGAMAQTQTPAPFPGWANKGGTPAGAAAASNNDLLGQWEGFVTQGDGSGNGQRTANVSLTITADKITSNSQGSRGEGTYRVLAGSGKYHQIDGTGTSGMYQGKVYQGIFTLEGNTLKWCSAEPWRPRPTTLRSNFAAGDYLMILTRKP